MAEAHYESEDGDADPQIWDLPWSKKDQNKVIKEAKDLIKEMRLKFGDFQYKQKSPENVEVKKYLGINSRSFYCGEINPLTRKPEGKGVLVKNRSALYEGYFRNGEYHGKGRLIDSDYFYYEGDWIDGFKQGYGVLGHLDTTAVYYYRFKPNQIPFIYKGTFKRGEKGGKGIYYYNNGPIYKGEISYGIRNGVGETIYPDGHSFHGTWVNDKWNGIGTLTTTHGQMFKGNWNGYSLNGTGTALWPDGRKYKGKFRDNKPVDSGYYTKANGEISAHVLWSHVDFFDWWREAGMQISFY